MVNVKKYFSVIILGAMVFGFIFPASGFFLKPYVSYILMVMMTLSALKIDLRELKKVSSDWWRYLVEMIFVFIIPILLVWLSRSFLEKEIYVGLVVVAAAPSAVAVVFMSDLLGGQPAKALVSTTLAHLISPFLMPFLIWILIHTTVSVPFLDILWMIIKLVIIPFMVAELVKKIPGYQKLLRHTGSFNTFLLIMILLAIVGPAQSLFLLHKLQTGIMFLLVFLILIVQFFICFWFGRNRGEDITWTIVSTYKNFALSSVVALSFFGNVALLGSVVFGIVSSLMLLPLQMWFGNNNK